MQACLIIANTLALFVGAMMLAVWYTVERDVADERDEREHEE